MAIGSTLSIQIDAGDTVHGGWNRRQVKIKCFILQKLHFLKIKSITKLTLISYEFEGFWQSKQIQ